MFPSMYACFSTSKDYTALKQRLLRTAKKHSFSTSKDYTALKPLISSKLYPSSFSTSKDYTALKPESSIVNESPMF